MIIYKLTNTKNGKVYIGQTIQALRTRLRIHADAALKRGARSAIASAIRKYGMDSFLCEVIETCGSRPELDVAEVNWIAHYNSLAPNGYNLETGGTSGHTVSQQTREKLRRARLGTKATPESRRLRSVNGRGIRRSDDTKERIRQARLGTERSIATREKIAEANRRRHREGRWSNAGESHPNAKLNWEIVRDIRRLHHIEGRSFAEIGRLLELHQGTVRDIAQHRRWKNDPLDRLADKT